MDVARKVVILARECGLQVELDTLVLESLVPEPLVGLDVDEFMAKLPEGGSIKCNCQWESPSPALATWLPGLQSMIASLAKAVGATKQIEHEIELAFN
eukprot:1159911-Pelagomonas_calceolata.AAC.10